MHYGGYGSFLKQIHYKYSLLFRSNYCLGMQFPIPLQNSNLYLRWWILLNFCFSSILYFFPLRNCDFIVSDRFFPFSVNLILRSRPPTSYLPLSQHLKLSCFRSLFQSIRHGTVKTSPNYTSAESSASGTDVQHPLQQL
jgi:hypothetical protein